MLSLSLLLHLSFEFDTIPRITKRRLDAPSYMFSHSAHTKNKLKTLRKTNKRSEEIRNLEVELNLSLLKNKQNFIKGFCITTNNDAYKFLRRLNQEQTFPEKMKYRGQDIIVSQQIAESFNEHFSSVFIEDNSDIFFAWHSSTRDFSRRYHIQRKRCARRNITN